MAGTKGNKNAYGAGSPKMEIAKYGKKTRFGAENGPDPRIAQMKWAKAKSQNASIRLYQKVLANSELVHENLSDIKLSDFKKVFGVGPKERLIFAQLAAVQSFKHAMVSPQAMQYFIDNIEGKLVQKNENKDTTSWADMLAKAYGGEGEAEDDGSE